ncbi:MAG TPA: sigma 54-interacting transcriptional regulator [Thermoanaerobaculia bacterium]|jgi:transcriptional regulator with PAS, ATPase and Fis domain|nr:sigma 54-interacting transcriptional regulator [Thermoanaerobaculia bacterium]
MERSNVEHSSSGSARGAAAQASGRRFTHLVGESPAMRRIKTLLGKIAASPSPTVLLLGESGTGKGVIAREIHDHSARASRPFQHILCSALPETLLESELFGHEAGAFTDARHRKKGLLELAQGGTVFLDEIGEFSASLQVKLLRFLEERVFRRLGGTADLRVDIRVIAATNRDLERAVRNGSFRADLFYRLSVLPVLVPPLRERRGDLPLLTRHFVTFFNAQFGKRIAGISREAMARLESHWWPGNVRELRNVIERAMLLSEGDRLTPEDFLALTMPPSPPAAVELPPEGIDLKQLERDLLRQALLRADGNRSQAARLLGLSRHQFRYRLEKLAGEDSDG